MEMHLLLHCESPAAAGSSIIRERGDAVAPEGYAQAGVPEHHLPYYCPDRSDEFRQVLVGGVVPKFQERQVNGADTHYSLGAVGARLRSGTSRTRQGR